MEFHRMWNYRKHATILKTYFSKPMHYFANWAAAAVNSELQAHLANAMGAGTQQYLQGTRISQPLS